MPMIKTPVGDIELSQEICDNLKPGTDHIDLKDEVSRIFRVAMRDAILHFDEPESYRIALSLVATESIRQVTGKKRDGGFGNWLD